MPRVMYITDFHFISFCFVLSWIMSSSSDVSALLHVSSEEFSICSGHQKTRFSKAKVIKLCAGYLCAGYLCAGYLCAGSPCAGYLCAGYLCVGYLYAGNALAMYTLALRWLYQNFKPKNTYKRSIKLLVRVTLGLFLDFFLALRE